jgi:hypothetical protein
MEGTRTGVRLPLKLISYRQSCYTDRQNEMSRKTVSLLLLSAAIVMVVLAAATLMPFPASMVSDLGYNALCPLAPWSTLALLIVGGICWAMRQHINRSPQ